MKDKFQPKRKKYLIWILAVLFLPIIILVAVYLCLPLLLEASIPPIARQFGIANFAMKVHKANWDNIDIRELQAGTGDNRGLKVGAIKFVRSNSSSKPNKITISDALIELDSLKGKVFIPGISLPSSNPTNDKHVPQMLTSLLKIPGALSSFISPSLDLEIKNSEVLFSRITKKGKVDIKLPVELKFSIDKKGFFSLKIEGASNKLRNVPYLPSGITCGKSHFSFEAEGVLYENKICEEVFAKFAISFADLKYSKGKNQSANIPELKVEGTVWQKEKLLIGEISTKFANAVYKMDKLELSNITFYSPLNFALADNLMFLAGDNENQGLMNIGKINFKNKNMGQAALAYKQQGGELLFQGSVKPVLLKNKAPSSKIVLKGKMAIPLNNQKFSVSGQAKLDCKNVKFDIGELVTKVEDMFFDGNIKLESGFQFYKGRFTSSANIAITDSTLEQEEKGLLINNLNFGFQIPDLMNIKSSPAQNITFDSMKVGELKFGKGHLLYQLESPKMLFLEKSNIQWCQGHIDFGAIRVDFDKPENIDFTLYCDRMNIADLLNQLKVAKAGGGGNVAGRIPIKFHDGKLVIKNGFLYSTPGEGGRIQLSDFSGSELADTSLQIALAREALKDYRYKWLRLTFNTVKKSLAIKFELDGAPNRMLPFTIDEKNVMKYDKRAKAKFHAISFDINFDVPIDHAIQFGKKTGSLFK